MVMDEEDSRMMAKKMREKTKIRMMERKST